MELCNALGESLGVVTVREDPIQPLRADEVLAVRPMAVVGHPSRGPRPLCRVALMYISMYTGYVSRRYSIAEARSRLPDIVDQAESGVEVELTRRGQPVAVLVSHWEFERLRGKRSQFGDAYRKFLQKHSLQEMGIEDDFAASTRDKATGRKVSL